MHVQTDFSKEVALIRRREELHFERIRSLCASLDESKRRADAEKFKVAEVSRSFEVEAVLTSMLFAGDKDEARPREGRRQLEVKLATKRRRAN